MKRAWCMLIAILLGACATRPARTYAEPKLLVEGPVPPRGSSEGIAAVRARANSPRLIERQLSNGVRVYVAPRDRSPVATLLVVIGTKALPTPLAVARVYTDAVFHERLVYWPTPDYDGASTSTVSGPDYVAFGLTTLAPPFADVVRRALPNLVRAPIDDEALDHAKEVIAAGILRREVSRVATGMALAGLFPSPSPYGTEARLGANDIGAVTLEQLRAFREKQVTTDNVAIVIAGNVDVEALMPILESGLRGLSQEPVVRTTSPSVSATCRDQVLLRERAGLAQTTIAIAFPAVPAASPERPSLDVLAGALAAPGSTNGRLQRALRHELRLAYGVHGHFAAFREGGAIMLSLAVENGRISEALARIDTEIDQLVTTPLETTELSFAKVRANHGLQDDGGTPALWAAGTFASGRPFDARASIEAVTADEVQSAARRYLRREARCIAIVGDPSVAAEPELAAGKFGAIVRSR